MKQDDLKLVLDALKWCHGGEPCGTAQAITVVEKALAQPEQEPSGHFLDFAYSDSIAYVHVYDQFRKGQQFYKASPQRTWVGLTEQQQ